MVFGTVQMYTPAMCVSMTAAAVTAFTGEAEINECFILTSTFGHLTWCAQEGKRAGFDDGVNTGFNQGKEAGFNDGIESGYVKGKDSGYQAGFQEGQSTTRPKVGWSQWSLTFWVTVFL
jgi:hypothetical protein